MKKHKVRKAHRKMRALKACKRMKAGKACKNGSKVRNKATKIR